MARVHIVEPGDWLGTLAERYGLSHASRIWNDPGNEALRQLRRTPDLLMVGDEVVVPEPDDDDHVVVPADCRAVFVARSQRDVLRVRVLGVAPFLAAFGPIDYELRTETDSTRGQISEDGQTLELELSCVVSKAQLVLRRSTIFELDIGGLGPADVPRGAMGRLESLGYTAEVVVSDSEDDEGQQAPDPLGEAVLRFQAEHGLPATGQLDATTQRALIDEYGA